MPISPIVLQRRHAELGRIRLGNQVATSNGFTRPNKLDAFRFTSPSQDYISDLAELYGGEPRPWDNNGKAEWEVFTTAKSIPVIAVKGGLSQWMEYWQGGGCIHRCDGEVNVLTGDECDLNEKVKTRVKGKDVWVNPHAEAKPTTRLSMMLPELNAIGVFRLESHGWNAAAEIPAVAELAQYVGDLVPAVLHLVERRTVKDGETSRFVVPVLDLRIGTARLKEIVAQVSGGTAALDAPPERVAIAAGPAAESPLSDEDLQAMDVEQLREAWKFYDDPTIRARIEVRSKELNASQSSTAEGSADDVVDAELVNDPASDDDADAVWFQILKAGGELGLTESALKDDFAKRMGMAASVAAAVELRAYLELLQTEGIAA